ncbi:MAG: PucR family transcriptional regulator [Oscillospiraceae bacterium]
MEITLNIVRDVLAGYGCEDRIPASDNARFRHISPVPPAMESFERDILYVTGLARAAAAAEAFPEVYWICTADGTSPPEGLRCLIVDGADTETVYTLLSGRECLLNRWVQEMQDAVIHNHPMQDVLDLSEPILKNYIQITDSSFKLLYYTRGIACDDPITVTARELGYHSEETVRLFQKFHRLEAWAAAPRLVVNRKRDVSRYDLISNIFRYQNTYFTHAVMTCNVCPYTPGLEDLFSVFIDCISVFVERDWEQKNSCSHIYDSFLSDLLDGQLTQEAIIEERAGYVGIPFTGRFMVAVLSAEEAETRPAGHIARALCERLPRSKILVLHGKIAVLHIRDSEAEGDVFADFEPVLGEYRICCGVSAEFGCLTQAAGAFQQARLSVRYAGLPGRSVFPGGGSREGFIRFEEAFPYLILGEKTAGKEIWESSPYRAALNRLRDYDGKKNTNNFDFLYVYLMSGCRSAVTAEAMFMHRNNVQYRVERIMQIAGLELGDPRVRFNLMLAYHMIPIYGLD